MNPSSLPSPDRGQYGWGDGGGQRPMREQHPEAVAILVLGLLSVVMIWPLGFVAWYMGNKAMRDVRARPGVYENESLITAGRILGIVGAVLTILFTVFFVGTMVFSIALPIVFGLG